ncbi:MAG: Heme biosynthesis protein [Candidatus Uhrbacteria bacterium GW2011_GWF2_39_13]|uniref:Heme biosynthesis protein n=1 Tax=Candidatus Uhrbacteria bacterium GW2011_GWF2_39_13 TaxID=1618995 RepID=A0A0G0MTW1_9BACT|nr:MAG: Heme biosynthesis protein [Candidatus Uhrbacteria bacterium GW2011_GWF2_39_13]
MKGRIKTIINARKAALKLLECKLTGRRIPVRVSLLITKYCNLRCFYCYAKDTLDNKDIKEPSLDDLKNIVDQIYDCGCRWINILGGEPLIRNDAGEFIDYAHNKGMLLEITTNGFFIRQKIEALKKVDHLCVSLDGDKEANDKSRGKDSFEKIIDGIKFAVENGLRVRVHATLCKRTMAEKSLSFLSDFCKSYNIKFNYSENGLPGIEELDPDFLLTEEETLNFYKQYRKLKKQGYPIVSSDVAVDYVAQWPLKNITTIYRKDLPEIKSDTYYPCMLGRNQCFISSNGDVYPCTKKWGYGKNIYEVGFKEAWEYLAGLDCVACKELGTIEQSVILGLNPKAILNAILNFS